MKEWEERGPEVAHLVNPAFCALMIREFAGSYLKECKRRPDVLLTFLSLPMFLHAETRSTFPAGVATKHSLWLQKNPHLKVGFAARCRSMAPFVREALEFGALSGLLHLTSRGTVDVPTTRLKSRKWEAAGDNRDCVDGARFTGRWLSRAGSVSTIYALWGVMP